MTMKSRLMKTPTAAISRLGSIIVPPSPGNFRPASCQLRQAMKARGRDQNGGQRHERDGDLVRALAELRDQRVVDLQVQEKDERRDE